MDRQDRQPVAIAGEVALSVLVMLAASAAGALLLSIAERGYSTLQALILQVAIPAGALIVVALAAAAFVGWRRLARGIVLGFWVGALATAPLELVRNVGFHLFQSMPGDLPRLMGVLMTGRIMDGPNLWSDVIGWTDHVWNGAMFGIIYALLVGGFPRRPTGWTGAGLGAFYGVLLATGFMFSSIPTTTGAGFFGSALGPKFAITVYLAHLGFGATLGWLVQRYGSELEPLWALALLALVRLRASPTQRLSRRREDPHPVELQRPGHNRHS